MRLQPVLSPTAIGLEEYLHQVGTLHLFDDDALHTVTFLREDREVEIVVQIIQQK